jgi:hypothetical protein
LRSITVRSTWAVVPSNWVIVAGLFATTEASPLATPEPAKARPMALTLFSFSWKPEAWAWPKDSTPAMPRASADRGMKR